MKKILLGTLLLFCFTLPAWSANFVEIARTKDWLTYVDVDSIGLRSEANHKYVVAWCKIIPRGESEKQFVKNFKQPAGYFMELSAYNIEYKQEQVLSFVAYNEEGTVLENDSSIFFVSKYEEIIPGTLGEDIYNFVMSRYKKK